MRRIEELFTASFTRVSFLRLSAKSNIVTKKNYFGKTLLFLE